MTEEKEPDQLRELKERLQSELDQGGASARQPLKEFETEVVKQHKKDGQWYLVAELATVSCETQESLENFIFCLNNVKAVIKPQTAISGLLLRMKDAGNSVGSDSLLPELIGSCLVARKGKKSGFSSRTLEFTSSLFDELRKGLKGLDQDFSRLGIEVWEATPEEKRSSGWCCAWARFTEGLLSEYLMKMRKKDRPALQGVANEYAQCLAGAGMKSADALIPLVSFLFTNVKVPDGPELKLIQTSDLGRVFRMQAALLSSGHGDAPSGAGPEGGGEASRAPARPPDTLLPESLPLGVRKIIKGMSAEIEKYLETRKEEHAEVLGLKDKFKAMVAKRDKAISGLEGSLSSLRQDIEGARKKLEELEKEKEALETKLDRSREDYELRDSMGQRDLDQSRKQVLLGVDKKIRTLCANLQLMIREVMKDPGKAGGLKNKWNQFDHVLWGEICGENGKGFEIGGE